MCFPQLACIINGPECISRRERNRALSTSLNIPIFMSSCRASLSLFFSLPLPHSWRENLLAFSKSSTERHERRHVSIPFLFDIFVETSSVNSKIEIFHIENMRVLNARPRNFTKLYTKFTSLRISVEDISTSLYL